MKNQLERIEDYAFSLERASLSEEQQALLLVGGFAGPITVENNCSCKNASGMNTLGIFELYSKINCEKCPILL